MSPSVRSFGTPAAPDAGSTAPARLPTAPDDARPFSEFAFGEANSFRAPRAERPGAREEPSPTTTSAEASASPLAETDERRPNRRAQTEDETDATATETLAWPCTALAISVPVPEEKPDHEGEANNDEGDTSLSVVADNVPYPADLSVPLSSDSAGSANLGAESFPGPTEATSAEAALLTGQDAPVADAAPTSMSPTTESAEPFSVPAPVLPEAGSATLAGRWTPIAVPTTATEAPSNQEPTPPKGTRGTSAAGMAVEVKNGFQQDEFAGGPADRPVTAVGWARSGSRDFSSEREAHRSDSSAVNPLMADPFRAANEPAAAEIELPAPLDVPATLTPLIQEQAVRLRHASMQSLEVVLSPDGQTELHLHLTQHGGQIEATVRCDRGDAEKFGGGWAKLQESLAAQGIRLAPLAEGSMSSAGDHSHRQPATPQPPPEAPAPHWPTAPAKTLLAPSRAPSPTTPVLPALAAARRTLESWA